MSNLQLIEELCDLVERQARVIRSLATSLEQERTLSEAEKGDIKAVEDKYTTILDADEIPDEYEQ